MLDLRIPVGTEEGSGLLTAVLICKNQAVLPNVPALLFPDGTVPLEVT